jgi:hypothetical protein
MAWMSLIMDINTSPVIDKNAIFEIISIITLSVLSKIWKRKYYLMNFQD